MFVSTNASSCKVCYESTGDEIGQQESLTLYGERRVDKFNSFIDVIVNKNDNIIQRQLTVEQEQDPGQGLDHGQLNTYCTGFVKQQFHGSFDIHC